MPAADTFTIFLVSAVAVVAASAVVALTRWMFTSRWRRSRGSASDSVSFLFDHGTLADATPGAARMLQSVARQGADIDRLVRVLAPRFPDLSARLIALPEDAPLLVHAADGSGTLEIECWQGMIRIRLFDDNGSEGIHPLAVAAMEEELRTLRGIGEDAPVLIWTEDRSGTVIWANRAYLSVVALLGSDLDAADPVWPPPSLFPSASGRSDDASGTATRHALRLPGRGDEQWFEITSRERGNETIRFATDATAAVAAEKAGKSFVQTFAKTFAVLSIGLAVFDRRRRLVIFNPALLDLTGLPVAFLSGRPSIHSVLDRLRDRSMLPEPRNYASWREQVAALEAEALEGTYCETWSLANGQTYRVTGRPHPDGALVFLIEDISDEVSLTRRFRGELQLSQSVLDSLPEAVAVFSPAGNLVMSNNAYDRQVGQRRQQPNRSRLCRRGGALAQRSPGRGVGLGPTDADRARRVRPRRGVDRHAPPRRWPWRRIAGRGTAGRVRAGGLARSRAGRDCGQGIP